MGRVLFNSEADMARVIVRWLADQRWEIFQEFQVKPGGARADIVAARATHLGSRVQAVFPCVRTLPSAASRNESAGSSLNRFLADL